ncbi:hypothetical protein BT96DRAFT_925980 [Gymnopus androsaceus JB14]|uniref:Uncharacterized protein n=1 Tax=Gymnopus androsaceus JB14 TaxID=1447944 RepID=A0A6A4GX30_9AGAR|nr:hypothetical protein BT96DRAFT_925980 [Gymnopus androsaceus JB14]
MSLKRSAAESPSRASKRRHFLFPSSSDPVTPAKTRSSIHFPSSSTPYPLYPSDSPSNPFGRTRTLSASLPPKTPFGRHLPLRFQFFRHGTKRDRDGVYRVVQVPLSYTFKHLKVLIAFLFGQFQRPSVDGDEETGHLFEIRKNTAMYADSYKPGTIKKSETSVRLSSSKDPYRYKQEWDYGEDWREDDEEFEDDDELSDEEDDPDVTWEAEEDCTLEHLWDRKSPSSETAIVYFDSSPLDPKHPVQIQITLFKGSIESRKGNGNSPYVFEARGHVYLYPLDVLEMDDGYAEEDLKMDIDPDFWNEPSNAFAKFLLGVIPAPEFSQSRESSIASTPSHGTGFLFSTASIRRVSLYTLHNLLFSCAQLHSQNFALAFSTSFPKYTPGPPPARRKRVAYLQKRIERSKHKGSNPFNDPDENDQAKTKPAAGPKGMDGRILTREEAMAIIGADDDVAEV